MTSLSEHAFNTIDTYMAENHNDPSLYPEWSGDVPADGPSGWSATVQGWRLEADLMMTDFEIRIGHNVQRIQYHIDKCRNGSLSDFQHYLEALGDVTISAKAFKAVVSAL